MISANIFTIDDITSKISANIQEKLDNTEKANIKLPIGAFLGIELLGRSWT